MWRNSFEEKRRDNLLKYMISQTSIASKDITGRAVLARMEDR